LGVNNVYSRREEPEKALSRCVERKLVPVVFGDFGVGKTSLVNKFFDDQQQNQSLVYFPSAEGLTMANVFRRVLEVLHYTTEVDQTSSRTIGGEGGFDKIIKAVVTREVTEESHRNVLITSPTDIAMLDIIDEAGLTLVIDEMHRATKDLRDSIASFIKALKGADKSFPTLVLIGTSTDAENLVMNDPGINRYIVEVSVPLMSNGEALYIVNEGFVKLELQIGFELAERIVSAAAGAPTIVHALCLDAAEAVITGGRTEVIEADCQHAVGSYLRDHGKRLANVYLKAIETMGPKRYRKQILHAVADTETDFATMEDIRKHISDSLEETVPSSALSGPLRDLKNPEYGAILQDVDRLVSGNRIHNLTSFSDPMMKSFVRFMGTIEDVGLMPTAKEFESLSSEAE
jgi:hypothetical protein